MSYSAAKGRRHQGEGAGGVARVHLIEPHGVIACGAFPRSLGKPVKTSLSGFVAGKAGQPICQGCRAMAKRFLRQGRQATGGVAP